MTKQEIENGLAKAYSEKPDSTKDFGSGFRSGVEFVENAKKTGVLLKYEVFEGILKTDCRFVKGRYGVEPIKTGSGFCTDSCVFFVSQNIEKQTVVCKHPNQKSNV